MKNSISIKCIALFITLIVMSGIVAESCDCKFEASRTYKGQHMPNVKCHCSGGTFAGACLKYTCDDRRILSTKGDFGFLYCKGDAVEATRQTGADGCDKCKNLNHGECQVQFLDNSYSPKWLSGNGFPN